jgi:tetratricopeptide (TPR) repeat protein
MTDGMKPTRRPRRPRSTAPTTPDPVEIAMEIEASGESPTGEASALLRRHSALIDEQIGLARKQFILASNEIFRNRIRSVRDIAIAAMVVALVVALGAVVASASRTTGLVVQPFSVPPELVEDGLDGRAVAALFLDELVRLDTTTSSTRTPASFRNDWSEAVTVEVEAGGLSITDAYTSLTRLLGSETYVSGGLSRTATGLELVIRSSEGWSVTVQGPADRREDLIRQAAGQVYEQSQPIRYASQLLDRAQALPDGPERQMLIERGRTKLATLLSDPSEITRIWAYVNLSQLSDTSLEHSIAFLQRAFELDPEHPSVVLNLSDDFYESGKWESSIQHSLRMAESISKPANLAKLNSNSVESYFFDTEARLAHLTGDRLREIDFYNRLIGMELPVSYIWRERRTQALIGLHEPPSLSRLLEDDALRAASGAASTNLIYFLRADAAASLDQWPQAVAALEASEVETEALALRFRPVRQISIWPRLAYARARTGDLAGAQALIATTPLDCYLCVRERARIAELAGNRTAADRWSAEARRQGPSLPFAFAERGQMLMARGDTAGAIAFYEEAIERGPRWADPQKYWGDALMAQGDEAGAIRKYRAAAERAPRWGALHLAWGRALEAQGRRDQAREKYTEAARMDLSAADRAEVVLRLGAIPARS